MDSNISKIPDTPAPPPTSVLLMLMVASLLSCDSRGSSGHKVPAQPETLRSIHLASNPYSVEGIRSVTVLTYDEPRTTELLERLGVFSNERRPVGPCRWCFILLPDGRATGVAIQSDDANRGQTESAAEWYGRFSRDEVGLTLTPTDENGRPMIEGQYRAISSPGGVFEVRQSAPQMSFALRAYSLNIP